MPMLIANIASLDLVLSFVFVHVAITREISQPGTGRYR
jgi:hypothetical protein